MTCGGLVSGSVVWEVGSSRLFSESIGVRIGGGCVSVCWRAGAAVCLSPVDDVHAVHHCGSIGQLGALWKAFFKKWR